MVKLTTKIWLEIAVYVTGGALIFGFMIYKTHKLTKVSVSTAAKVSTTQLNATKKETPMTQPPSEPATGSANSSSSSDVNVSGNDSVTVDNTSTNYASVGNDSVTINASGSDLMIIGKTTAGGTCTLSSSSGTETKTADAQGNVDWNYSSSGHGKVTVTCGKATASVSI